MNKVILVGNLTKDPELSETPNIDHPDKHRQARCFFKKIVFFRKKTFTFYKVCDIILWWIKFDPRRGLK